MDDCSGRPHATHHQPRLSRRVLWLTVVPGVLARVRDVATPERRTPGTTNRRELRTHMGSVIKKRRKRMSKKKHRKLLRKTRVQRRKLKK